MIKNHPLEVVYFNPLTGGIKGARGNYEMDYYYHSTRSAAEKLKDLIKSKNEDKVIVAGNFATKWFFRDFPQVTSNIYTPFYYKHSKDWDYNIITAAYMYPYSLKPGTWPPEGTIFTIDVNSVPVCAVIERQTKDDLKAYRLIEEEKYDTAIVILENVISRFPYNETAYTKLAETHIKLARYLHAQETLEKCLEKFPCYEPALLLKAEAEQKAGKTDDAIKTLKYLLSENYKYLQAYINLAQYLDEAGKPGEAVKVLNTCLKIKSGYKDAIKKLEEIKNINKH
jgi:tetratricopeptide (TPR) repeat protein